MTAMSYEERVEAHQKLKETVDRFIQGLYKLADQNILQVKYRTHYEIQRALRRYSDLFMLVWRREHRNSLLEEHSKQRIQGFSNSLDRLAKEIENGEHRTNDQVYQAMRKRLDRFYAEWKSIRCSA